jgi:hypothetical protein
VPDLGRALGRSHDASDFVGYGSTAKPRWASESPHWRALCAELEPGCAFILFGDDYADTPLALRYWSVETKSVHGTNPPDHSAADWKMHVQYPGVGHYREVATGTRLAVQGKTPEEEVSQIVARAPMCACHAAGVQLRVSLWLLLAFAAIPQGAWALGRLRRDRRRRKGLCLACGYDLRGSGDRCPECGTERPPAGATLRVAGAKLEMGRPRA